MTPTRRTVLRRLAAGTAGILFSPAATAASRRAGRSAQETSRWSDELLDRLAQESAVRLERGGELLAAMGEDYGRLVRGECRAAAYPASAFELQTLVRFARRHRVQLTLRGAGYSQGGQAVADGSVTVRFNAMNAVVDTDPAGTRITVAPGATWRSVLATTAPRGFAPEVLPAYLDLTVGGTLAVGGIGSSSHRFGATLSGVEELEVVTGEGAIVRCGPGREADLFQATLGGTGRCAAITSATIRLRKIHPFVRTFTLLYDDAARWIADQRLLAGSDRIAYLEGFVSAAGQGYRLTRRGKRPFAEWFYGLLVSVEFEHPAGIPDAAMVLKGLGHIRLTNTEDEVHGTFLERLDTPIGLARKTGAFMRPHPHFAVLLPVPSLPDLIPQILPLLPLTLGDGHRLHFLRSDALPRFFMRPQGRETALFAVRPEGVPEIFLDETLDHLRGLHAVCISAGGRMYLPGWLGMMDAAAWRSHFETVAADLALLHRRHDPDNVFHSLLHSSIPEI